jgi:DNA ligase-1
MAKICSVPISFLVMRGQGIKLLSLISCECRKIKTLIPVIEKGDLDEGYEGAIIRNFYGPYKTNHRSPNLQKYKSFMDDEYIITNGFEATGRDIGTVIFQCSTPDGKLFNVRPKGTRLQRKEWLTNINTLIGKKLTVKFQNLSNDGIPRFPVGINIREGY